VPIENPQVLVARKLDDPRQGSCPDLCRQAVRYASSSPAADLAGGPSFGLWRSFGLVRGPGKRFFFPQFVPKSIFQNMNFILLKFIENFNKFQ